MQSIIGYFHKLMKFIIIHILFKFIEVILSWDIGKPDGISHSLSKKFIQKTPQHIRPYPDPSLNPYLPKAIIRHHPNYIQLLKQAAEQGEPIKPIKHRKPIAKNIVCPKCKATYEYIYLNAKVQPKHKNKKVQKYRCKVCLHQWFSHTQKRNAIFYCPFCRKKLYHKRTRKDFDIYICKNQLCAYLQKTKQHYIYRDYFFNINQLYLAVPEKPLVNLANSRFCYNVMGLSFTLHINFHLNYRATSDFLYEIFNIKIAASTIYNWCQSLAYLLAPIVTTLPIATSNMIAIDETYERYAGYWGYYYAALDAKYRFLIAPHFSNKRSVKAVTTTIMGTLKRMLIPHKTIYIVHDCFPTYFLAIQLINQASDYNLISLPVTGLKDPKQPNPFRKYKNIIERYFGTIKPYYYLCRGFGTKKGAIAYCILNAIDYNYFHPHQLFNFSPPLKIPNLKSNHPVEKWNKLIQMALCF
jgi:transposase-like protein